MDASELSQLQGGSRVGAREKSACRKPELDTGQADGSAQTDSPDSWAGGTVLILLRSVFQHYVTLAAGHTAPRI
jgi:hypothetical protein